MVIPDEILRTWATRVEAGACPYLPDRQFDALLLPAAAIGSVGYRALLDQRFRRLGEVLYQPDCQGCQACEPLRVAVADFRERRDQRRCRRRNADLVVGHGPRCDDEEHRALYRRYQAEVHDDHTGDSQFGEPGGMQVVETTLRNRQGRLVGVAISDRFADALSSVYCYYDPDLTRRSLGTYLALCEIDRCRAWGLRWWYLGYFVAGCRKMVYKARFCPHQVLRQGRWITVDEPPEPPIR